MNAMFQKSYRSYKKLYNRIIQKLKKQVERHYGERLTALVIFGSVASDRHSPESDIDIFLVLKDPKTGYEEHMEFIEHIEEKVIPEGTYVRLNPIFLSPEDLKPEKPIFWWTDFLILLDREDTFKRFLLDLNRFKEKHLRYHEKPMPYIEIING